MKPLNPFTMRTTILEHTFELMPDRALLWLDKNTLIVSDLHLGKSGHFRKSGIAAPNQINQTNIHRLESIVDRVQPDRLLILGDLFHSDMNREWLQFEEWRGGHAQLQITLVAGNHDTLHSSFYREAKLTVCHELEEENVRFVHDITNETFSGADFTFSGHIHPGVRLRGKGRQSLRLPCFYQTADTLILPAFGEFTGLYILPEKGAKYIYPIAENKVFQVSHV